MFRKDEAAKQQNDIISIQNNMLCETSSLTYFYDICKCSKRSPLTTLVFSHTVKPLHLDDQFLWQICLSQWQKYFTLPSPFDKHQYDFPDSSLATSMFLCWYPFSVSVKCTHILVVITATSLKILWLLHLKLHNSFEFQCRILKYTVTGEYDFQRNVSDFFLEFQMIT